MAILKKKELRKLSEKELSDKTNELQLELAKERANIAIGATVTSPGRIKEIRKTIARIKTELKSRAASGKKEIMSKGKEK
jgi:large subunit ribosomal protein L29